MCAQRTSVKLVIASCARRPCPLSFNKATGSNAHGGPKILMCHEAQHGARQILCIIRPKEDAGFAVVHQLPMPANIRGKHDAAPRHGLKRLQRGYRLGKAHTMARIYEYVDEIVVASNELVRHLASKAHRLLKAEMFDLLFKRPLRRSPANEQHH